MSSNPPSPDEHPPTPKPSLSGANNRPPGGGGGRIATGTGGGGPRDGDSSALFAKAAEAHDQGEFDRAMTLWARGLSRSPANPVGLEGFFRSTMCRIDGAGDPGPTEAVPWSTLESGTRYLNTLACWASRPADPLAAVQSAQVAANAGLKDHVRWIATRAGSRIDPTHDRARTLYLALGSAYAIVGDHEESQRLKGIANQLPPPR